MAMNIAIFWDAALCNPYVNRRFGGTYHLHLERRKSTEKETYPHTKRWFLAQLIFDTEDLGDVFL
jgi:hypothetical protein